MIRALARAITIPTLKSKYFTVSIIGKPNVGKSTLFNALVGERLSLVHPMPGLTRDRKEGKSYLLKVPIKVVDTAGWEGADNLNDMSSQMIDQTRRALIYSDLALFMIDGRKGIDNNDIALSDWLSHKLAQQKIEEEPTISEEEKYKLKIQKEREEINRLMQKYKGKNLKREIEAKKKELQFINSFKAGDIKEVKIPKILLICNKCENSYFPDIYSDLHALNYEEKPILISAEHGDNIADLIASIHSCLPKDYTQFMTQLIHNRNSRHKEIKNEQLEELKEQYKDITDKVISDWSKEYEIYNPNPEDNSDYDDENAINKIPSPDIAKAKITTKNSMKGKPIQISIVGRPNVGKSSIINSLLKENRLIISDIPGTTRDSIPIQWLFNVVY